MDQPVNPYAPPQNTEPQGRPPPLAPLPAVACYRSARDKATLAVYATVLDIVLQLLVAGSFLLQIMMLQGAAEGGLDPATAQANDVRHFAITIASFVVTLASFIMLLVWVYATHANLPALRAPRLEFTPGWAVGWFFIPIMNLFKPCQAMFELWNTSDPGRLVLPGLLPGQRTAGDVIGWWWGLRIAGVIADRVFSAAAQGSTTIEGLTTTSWIAIALVLAMDIPMRACQVFMIQTIQKFQDQRHELIVKNEPASGLPESSSFNPFAGPA